MANSKINKISAFFRKHALKILLVSLGVIVGGATLVALPFVLPALAAGAVIGSVVGGASLAAIGISGATISGVKINDRRIDAQQRIAARKRSDARKLEEVARRAGTQGVCSSIFQKRASLREKSIIIANNFERFDREKKRLLKLKSTNEELKLEVEAIRDGREYLREEHASNIEARVSEEMGAFDNWVSDAKSHHERMKAMEPDDMSDPLDDGDDNVEELEDSLKIYERGSQYRSIFIQRIESRIDDLKDNQTRLARENTDLRLERIQQRTAQR